MIAVDTNLLVHAVRAESVHHARAIGVMTSLAEGAGRWALPWPCVYEFVKIVTHPRIFAPPTALPEAIEMIEAFMDSPTVVLLGDGPSHRAFFRETVLHGRAVGNAVHDAHIAALALENGVTELLTADRDFGRFPGLRVRNPLV